MSAVLRMEVLQSLPKAVEPVMKRSTLMTDAREVLLQGLTLLFGLDDHRYSQIAGAPFKASIGQHYRHVIEHFQSLTRGLQSGEINYDARDRNVRLQSEVTYSSIATCDILRVLKRYTDDTLVGECTVINSVGYGSAGASTFQSNISRELAYCAGHAIHHYAIIRLLCHEIGVSVPAEFGFAPSTLKHMSSLAAV
ncbi:MAG: hypothetical protein DMG76_30075 [Acidobacteria bacterium]|nr:MAG: hypothetical protein DMG76_30075 [Acidobacteriota bacterium]